MARYRDAWTTPRIVRRMGRKRMRPEDFGPSLDERPFPDAAQRPKRVTAFFDTLNAMLC